MSRSIDEYDSSELVEVDVEYVEGETEKAWLLRVDGEKHWVPKSQVQELDHHADGELAIGWSGAVEIPAWFADQEEIDY